VAETIFWFDPILGLAFVFENIDVQTSFMSKQFIQSWACRFEALERADISSRPLPATSRLNFLTFGNFFAISLLSVPGSTS
jgi:hypothetical protein